MSDKKTFYSSLVVIPVFLSIAGGVVAFEARYVKESEVVNLISANAQQIAILKIETAKQSKNQNLLRRLCDDFKRMHKWTPSACQ